MKRYSGLRGRAFLFLLFLWFLWFMNFSCRTIFAPIMPLIEDEFAVSHARASSLFAFISFGYGCSLFASGVFSGFLGYKKSIILSMAVTSCIFFVIPHLGLFSLLILFALLLGLSTGIYLPSIIPLITEYYDERTWGRAIAIHDTAASMSIFTAPLITVLLLKLMPWRGMFYVFGFFFIIANIVFYFVVDEMKVQLRQKGFLGSLMKSRSLWMLGTIWIFAAGACLGLYFVLPLYLTKELGLDIRYANTIFGMSRLGGVAIAVLAGFVVDRFSLKKTIFIVLFATGLFTILVTCVHIDYIEFFLFLQASISTAFFPVALVAISRMFDKEKRGMATGFIVTLGVIFGLGIIPYLLGLAGDYITFKLGIFIFGVLVVLASGLTYYLKGLR